MAAGFSFKMEGLNKLQSKLDRLPKTLTAEIKEEVRASAEKIAKDAKNTASSTFAVTSVAADTGTLMRSISAKHDAGPLTSEVVVQAHYAPYVEFGTGALVEVPAGLESYAMQFKGRGVRQVNLPARPFLFNNYLRERPEIIKRLKAIIADL